MGCLCIMNANKGKGCFGIGLKEGNKIVYLWVLKENELKMLSGMA